MEINELHITEAKDFCVFFDGSHKFKNIVYIAIDINNKVIAEASSPDKVRLMALSKGYTLFDIVRATKVPNIKKERKEKLKNLENL